MSLIRSQPSYAVADIASTSAELFQGSTMDPDTTFSAGQRWHAPTDERRIDLISRNAAGDTLVGYECDTGTGLATEAEFAEWLRAEVAVRV